MPLVSIALIGFLLSQIDLKATAGVLSRADLGLVALAICFTTISLALKTVRWQILLSEKQAIPFKELFPIQVAGIATSNFSPGKMLEALKVVPLKQRGLTYSYSMLTVFWERGFDLVVLFGFSFSVISLLDPAVGTVLTAIFIALVAAMLLMFRHFEKILTFVKKHVKLAVLEEVKPHSFKKRTLFAAFLVTAVAWLADAGVMFASFRAVGLDYEFMRILSAYAASIIVGVVSFLPGGIGSTEAAFLLLLGTTKAVLPQVFGAILLGRLASLGFSSLLGFALLPLVKKN